MRLWSMDLMKLLSKAILEGMKGKFSIKFILKKWFLGKFWPYILNH